MGKLLKIKYSISVILFFLIKLTLSASTPKIKRPYSFNKQISPVSKVYSIDKLNKDSLLKTSILESKNNKKIAFKFGEYLPVKIDFFQQAQKDTLLNKGIIYRLLLELKKATSININYSAFFLKEGSYLFLYDFSKINFLGPYKFDKNRSKKKFATSIIKANKIILEYFEPFSNTNNTKSEIKIDGLIYGFTNFLENQTNTTTEDFGNAAYCNVNAICKANDLNKVLRSDLMILAANNTRVCSGTLLNNLKQDHTPYVLTAAHCPVSANSIFMFDYKSPNCSTNIDGVTNKTVTGSTLLFQEDRLDAKLLKINTPIPKSFNVHYAGWNTILKPRILDYCLHHPRGDIMKVSTGKQLAFQETYPLADTYFNMVQWTEGVTESGSSGSGLYNSNQQLIGALSEGSSFCSTPLQEDIYFNLYYAMDWQSKNYNTIRSYLANKVTSKELSLNGIDADYKKQNIDLGIIGFKNISLELCSDTLKAEVIIHNFGTQVINNFKIKYLIDKQSQKIIDWAGNLLPDSTVEVVLNKEYIFGNKVKHSITGEVFVANDSKISNNELSKNFAVGQNSVKINFEMNYDDFPRETSFYVYDENKKVVYFRRRITPAIPNFTNLASFCLSPNCYTFVLKDEGSDGFSGDGHLLTTKTNKNGGLDTLVYDTSFNARTKEYPICIGDSCTLSFIADITNYTDDKNRGSIKLKILGGSNNYTINWNIKGLQGKEINNLNKDIYTVNVKDNKYKNCNQTAEFEIVQVTKSVNIIKKTENFINLFPNPSNTGKISAIAQSFKELKKIQVYNILGQKLKTSITKNKKDNKREIEILNAQNGMYIIQFIFNTSPISKLLFINK